VHAADFAGLPATGITPVVCGDAHLGNFGFYASPERDLVFDLNDFDEAHPGAWEWDLRRLTTSVWVAGRQNGSSEDACGDAVARCVEEYRRQIAAMAEQPLLARSFERLDVDRMLRSAPDTGLRAEIAASARRARRRTSDRALPRITEERDGVRRIAAEPPLVTRPREAEAEQVAAMAEQPLLTRSFERLDVDRMLRSAPGTGLRAEIAASARRARRRTSDRALPRITEERDGVRRIAAEPPLVTRPREAEAEQVAEALDAYLTTLPPHWARVVGGYRLVDVAHKVVGVGSVGLRAWVALCEGSAADDVLFLQLKQARRSVIAPYVHGDSAWHAHQGQRVVEYQQALQTVSDPLLGWTTVGDVQYYVRQFRDMKGAITVDGIHPAALTDYAGICGFLLAKGHARTSGASMIAGYLGTGPKVRTALCRFARAYADQTERDHAALVSAVRRGALPAETGI
jgi:uncharacterized protein (DUF2252 family)